MVTTDSPIGWTGSSNVEVTSGSEKKPTTFRVSSPMFLTACVQRHKVYRHFPTEAKLFASCSGHFAALHPWPDTDAWSRIDDPRERLATGIDELYRWYEETGEMWTRILRDRELVEAIEPALRPFYDYIDRCAGTLSAGWGLRGRRKRLLEASIRHAVEFATWQSLVRSGDIARSEAVSLMTALATASAS